jgi:hypothetical protein
VNRKPVLEAVIWLLLTSLVVAAPVVEVARANFITTHPVTDPPVILVFSPTNKTYYAKEVLLNFNATLPHPNQQDLSQVSYSLDNQTQNIPPTGDTYNDHYNNWSITLDGLSEGTHVLQVTAKCKCSYIPHLPGPRQIQTFWGYSDVVTFTIVFPPEISILSIENRTYQTNTLKLDFMVSKPVSSIAYSLDNNSNVSIDGNTTLTGLPDGAHSILVYANGTDGNASSPLVNFAIDATAPTISNLSIENKTYNTTGVTLNFNIDEPVSWMKYSLDGMENVAIAENATLLELSEGSHSITLYACDLAGNTASASTASFSVNTKQEVPPNFAYSSFLAAVGIAGAIAVSTVLGAIMYKRKESKVEKQKKP